MIVLVGSVAPSGVSANARDPNLPQLNGWHWSAGFVGSYRFASTMPLQWMRNEASAGVNVVSNSSYRNPDFNLTSSSSANVDIGMSDANTDRCGGPSGTLYWVGCAEYGAS